MLQARNSGSVSPLEPSEPVHDCTEIAYCYRRWYLNRVRMYDLNSLLSFLAYLILLYQLLISQRSWCNDPKILGENYETSDNNTVYTHGTFLR